MAATEERSHPGLINILDEFLEATNNLDICTVDPDTFASFVIEAFNQVYELGKKDGSSEWVKAEQEIPEYGKKVVVFVKRASHPHKINFATFNGTGWRTTSGNHYKVSSITHWMPLPKPPKE